MESQIVRADLTGFVPRDDYTVKGRLENLDLWTLPTPLRTNPADQQWPAAWVETMRER